MVVSKEITMAESETYMRGQAIWALWHWFSRGRLGDAVPSHFVTRVRKMGELGVPIALNERPGKPGVDIRYTPEDVFELCVALTLQDTGLKQSEVAFLIHYSRADLRAWYREIMIDPPPPRQGRLHSDLKEEVRHKTPTRLVAAYSNKTDPLADRDRRREADQNIYMVFRYSEVKEAWNLGSPVSHDGWQGKGEPPIILKPKYLRGVVALAAEFDHLSWGVWDKVRIVVELSSMAATLTTSLQQAPLVTRGR